MYYTDSISLAPHMFHQTDILFRQLLWRLLGDFVIPTTEYGRRAWDALEDTMQGNEHITQSSDATPKLFPTNLKLRYSLFRISCKVS